MNDKFTIQYQIDHNMFNPNTLLLLERYREEIEEEINAPIEVMAHDLGIEEAYPSIKQIIEYVINLTSDMDKDIEALSNEVNSLTLEIEEIGLKENEAFLELTEQLKSANYTLDQLRG